MSLSKEFWLKDTASTALDGKDSLIAWAQLSSMDNALQRTYTQEDLQRYEMGQPKNVTSRFNEILPHKWTLFHGGLAKCCVCGDEQDIETVKRHWRVHRTTASMEVLEVRCVDCAERPLMSYRPVSISLGPDWVVELSFELTKFDLGIRWAK